MRAKGKFKEGDDMMYTTNSERKRQRSGWLLLKEETASVTFKKVVITAKTS